VAVQVAARVVVNPVDSPTKTGKAATKRAAVAEVRRVAAVAEVRRVAAVAALAVAIDSYK
jgi:hypothetical protein